MNEIQINLLATIRGVKKAEELITDSDDYGFAQVIVAGKFGKFLLDSGLATVYSRSRVRMEIHTYSGSHEKRKAFANGYAEVLNEFNIPAIVDTQIEEDFEDDDYEEMSANYRDKIREACDE